MASAAFSISRSNIMSTPEQIAANQANAQKSTGPKTEAGKAASSQNSWQHGLTFGIFRVLDNESPMDYQILLQTLIDEYKPVAATEAILVERMAQHHWLRNRAITCQNYYLESGVEFDTVRVSLFMRYESMHERAYHKCLADILKLRAERQKAEIGFASQAHKQEMQRLEVLCREADLSYHDARAVGAQLTLECKQQDQQAATPRQIQEVPQQKAA
jgi:hypothetical protein